MTLFSSGSYFCAAIVNTALHQTKVITVHYTAPACAVVLAMDEASIPNELAAALKRTMIPMKIKNLFAWPDK